MISHRLQSAEGSYSLVRGPTAEIATLYSTGGNAQPVHIFGIGLRRFPTVTLYARKLMARFSSARSSITSEQTPLLSFFGKVLQ